MGIYGYLIETGKGCRHNYSLTYSILADNIQPVEKMMREEIAALESEGNEITTCRIGKLMPTGKGDSVYQVVKEGI